MNHDKLRRQIIEEAARLLLTSEETGYQPARLRAARLVSAGPVQPASLPTNREIREALERLASALPCTDRVAGLHQVRDRFLAYQLLLAPLEEVQQKPETHPEGDALYHSLQVFTLARDALPYDEEFQTAALLHDVGKAIDPRDHIAAGLAALDGHITERTHWLIENHAQANALRDGTIGVRARRRLEAAADFDTLMLLCDCDRRGRQRGANVPDLEEALAQLRDLADEYREDGDPDDEC